MKNKHVEPELTTGQASKILGCSPASVMRYCRAKNLPHHRIQVHGRKPSIRIRLSELQSWADVQGFALTDGAAPLSAEKVAPIAGFPEIEPAGNPSRRIEQAELQAYNAWRDAERTGKAPMMRQRIWLAWAKALAEIEKANLKSTATRTEIEQGLQAAASEHITKHFAPVREFLSRMPCALAGRVNPADALFAESALRDWLDKQLLPMLNRPIFPTETVGK